MKARKHEAMYERYGKHEGCSCKECLNYIFIKPTDRRHSKCAAYGITHSEATDWNGRKAACGLFNKNVEDMTPLIEQLKHGKRVIVDEQCEGQISMEA